MSLLVIKPEDFDLTVNRVELLKSRVAVEGTLLSWMAVHGNLSLALRHPGNTGASTEIVKDVIRTLSTMLVEQGVFTADAMAAANLLGGIT